MSLMDLWDVKLNPERCPAYAAIHTLRLGRCRAYLFVTRRGAVEWTVRRVGELGTRWRTDDSVEAARRDCEDAIEDMPVLGPLTADMYVSAAMKRC